ncbi:MAG: class II aldolase and adducin N-terminal domain-containing protein [Pseudomonadota bacterium]
MSVTDLHPKDDNLPFWQERVDLAASFRWTARLNMHEGVSNHFSVSVNDDGTKFLMNPNQVHFSLIKASDLLLLDANDPDVMDRPGAPDPTAWGLHGSLHRLCPHARCAMHVHSIHATVLATLKDPTLPPLDQNCALFFDRIAYDTEYGGLALDDEAERACQALKDPTKQVLVMGNHGIMVIGETVAEAFNRMYYFERACEIYIKALWTGRDLAVIDDAVAAQVARESDEFGIAADKHLDSIKALLDQTEQDYKN